MDTQTKLLNVVPFQETLGGGYCGPASLKLVLDYHGINKTEEELSQMCNRDPDLGVNDQAIKNVAQKLGLNVEIENNASFEDIKIWLEKGVPVIVNWFTRGRYDYPEDDVADGHYSVVVGLDEEYIYLQDPEIGRVRKIEREDFLRVWFDFSTDYIAGWKDMIIRQLIAIYR